MVVLSADPRAVAPATIADVEVRDVLGRPPRSRQSRVTSGSVMARSNHV
jgi:hypothetical protein